MAKANSPQHTVCLATYADLQRYVRAFAEGHLNLLMIFGRAGVGKTRLVRRTLGSQVCWIGGQASPFGIFLDAYLHRHQPLVLDDVDGLHRDRNGIRLLKALCQTERAKTLCWLTDAPTSHGVPQRFTTTSRVLMVGNQWQTLNADVAALEDRGHLLLFEPTAFEVHSQAAQWFWDQEIFDLIADHLHLFGEHSLRSYLHGWELKRADLDWRHGVLSRCLRGVALEVAKLKGNPAFCSEAERVQAFVRAGAGCRATYFRHAKKVQPAKDRPQIRLVHTSPPAELVLNADYLGRLQRRFGELGNG